ncbi:MAG TPA: hypothetical protein VGM69_25980 [Chloroflexota bacterium]
MEHQEALTILAEIEPDQKAELEHVLEAVGASAAQNDVIPFGRLPNVHFARFVVLDETTDLAGARIPPFLAYMSDVDGTLERHLEELVDLAGEGIDRVFGRCVGYPPGDNRTRRTRLAFLHARTIGSGVVYVNTVGRTVRQIHREAQLREAIQDFLDRPEHDWSLRTPQETRAAIQQFVRDQPTLSWAKAPEPPLSLSWRVKEKLHFAGALLGLLALSPIIIAVFPSWLVMLRLHELSDVPENVRPTAARLEQLAALEDHVVQNQLSAIGFVKPGWFRQFTVAVVSWLTILGARHLFNNGNLGGVKTIHFARWVSVNEGRRILFAPNYDGSLDRYMGDFIDQIAWGLNAHDSNGFGFPKTSWLIFGGANNEEELKNYVRNHQIITQVWYTAYPELSTANIDNNARIRVGLYGQMTDDETRQWLARL